MTSPPDRPKRWRPTFSVRTLVVLVTLVCCYFGSRLMTHNQGTNDVRRHVADHGHWNVEVLDVSGTPIPFVVVATSPEYVSLGSGAPGSGPGGVFYGRGYYLWFFGYVARFHETRHLALSLS